MSKIYPSVQKIYGQLILCSFAVLSVSACNAKNVSTKSLSPDVSFCMYYDSSFKAGEMMPCGLQVKELGDLCLANLKSGFLEKAVEQCNKIIELTPASQEGGQLLANEYKRQAYLYIEYEHYKESADSINKFFELANSNLALYDPERIFDAKLLLGVSYDFLDNYSGSEKVYDDLINDFRKQFGANSEKILLPESYLARTYFYQDKFEEAEKRFLAVINAVERSKNPSDAYNLDAAVVAYAGLGRLYLKQSKLKASESQLIKAYGLMNKRLGENSIFSIDVVQDLEKVYGLMGNADKEKKFKRIAAEISAKH
jgi:tetratricopeptide (TPR) repeat protein